MDCAYCPPYAVKLWVELSDIFCLWHAHTTHSQEAEEAANAALEHQTQHLICNIDVYQPCTDTLHRLKHLIVMPRTTVTLLLSPQLNSFQAQWYCKAKVMFPAALCHPTPRLHNSELAAEKLTAEVFTLRFIRIDVHTEVLTGCSMGMKHPAGVDGVTQVWESSTVAINTNLQVSSQCQGCMPGT